MQVLLTVAYDGTSYAGWQRQANSITVQEKIEDALTQLLGRAVSTRASSRTDAGVHALGQRVTFNAPDLRIPIEKLPTVLVGLLPTDISVLAAEVVTDDFHVQYHTKYKTYEYNIYSAPCPNPLNRRYSAFVPREINVDAMKKAAKFFVGSHDFAGFCAVGGSAKTTVREIFDCSVRESNNMVTLSITGSGFLYNMVRIIAGTVLYVGLGKINPDNIPEIIKSCDRKRAGKTMPPEGLTLKEVFYENQ